MSYHVFHRTWWKRNPAWPDGREPHAGRKHTLARYVATEEAARRLCQEWRANHEPGPLSDKAEYEREG